MHCVMLRLSIDEVLDSYCHTVYALCDVDTFYWCWLCENFIHPNPENGIEETLLSNDNMKDTSIECMKTWDIILFGL